MVSDLHCLLDRLCGVLVKVGSSKNVTFIKKQNLESKKEESIANQTRMFLNKIAASESKKIFVENKMEDRVC